MIIKVESVKKFGSKKGGNKLFHTLSVDISSQLRGA